MLKVSNINQYYGGSHILRDVSLTASLGKITVLLGRNGVGKTTLLKCLMGLVPIKTGQIELAGQPMQGATSYTRARAGMGYVPQGREIFPRLTVQENLRMGAYTRTDKAEIARNLEKVYAYFPRLKTRRGSQAAYTSGGEQQMCAIGRALMTNPNMVLLDEPSMGLAPQIVEEVFNIVKDLNAKEGTTFLLAEQNTNMALKYADYGYIMESGRIVMDGKASDLASNEDVKEFYLGVGGGERKSFRDVKSYKRRKRWLA